MADLFSLSIRRTSGNDGRPAMRAMSSGNSYHFRPHCTKRAASAMTCARATSEGPSRSDDAACLAAGLAAALTGGAAFAEVPNRGGCLLGLAAGLEGATALRSVRAICAVLWAGGAGFAPGNFGISRVP